MMCQKLSGGLQNNYTVTLLASLVLVRDYLQRLIQNSDEISVLDSAKTRSELTEKIYRRQPDVVLICLLDGEHENIKMIPDVLKTAPQTKIVLLVDSNEQLDQKEALKLGATGIVELNQSVRSLIQAIRQVAEGETWLNQKLVAQLLNSQHAKGKTKHKSYLRNDALTNREIEVVQMIGLGMQNKGISEKLFISEATVRHHLSSIYGKLNIQDRLNLVIYAYQNGIVKNTPESSRLFL